MQVIKTDSNRVFVVADDAGKELAKIYINQNGPFDIAYTPKDDNWLAHGDDPSYWQADPELKAFCEAQAQELGKQDFGDQNELEKLLFESKAIAVNYDLGLNLTFKNGLSFDYVIGQNAPAEIYRLLPAADKKIVNKLFKELISNRLKFHEDEIVELSASGALIPTATNKKLFNAALLKADITKEDLAKKVGISTPNLYHKLNGVVAFNQRDLRLIKVLLQLNDKDFCDIFFR